jgi:MPBQ/MSBQ methyltransferase
MLFPAVDEYRAWFAAAGFGDVEVRPVAPAWHREGRVPYAVAVAGVKRAGTRPALAAVSAGPPAEDLAAPLAGAARLRVALRFALGSAAGAAWLPIAAALTVRARIAERRGG